MRRKDISIQNVFIHSKKENPPDIADLVEILDNFLDRFGESPLVGSELDSVVRNGDGKTKFERLLAASGYKDNPDGYFFELLTSLGKANGTGKPCISGPTLPRLALMAIFEIVIPGNTFETIKSVKQLEQVSNTKIPERDRDAIQKVLDIYPVRLSTHVIRQMRLSRPVARQYMPFAGELDQRGHAETWNGHFCAGIMERMYANRAIFLLNMSCPVYCRFCFRKHKASRKMKNPTPGEVGKAVDCVRNSADIKEILITGGDPFLNRENFSCAIDGLMDIPHVRTLRLATRSVASYPQLFLAGGRNWLHYLKRKNDELRGREKRMELAIQFNHPDEISIESLDIITELSKTGITVYIQTPFLKNVSDNWTELARLFGILRGAGAEMHYIFLPCHSIHGTSDYWTSISKGIKAAGHLRAHLSDRAIPKICAPTSIGKMDWHTSGWAVEPVKGKENFIWIRTPYTPDYFKAFAPVANKLGNIRLNEEGTIDIQCMAEIGDDSLFLGPRQPKPETGIGKDPKNAGDVRHLVLGDQRLSQSIVETGLPGIWRLHETRVELDAEAAHKDLSYINNDKRITDVIISSQKDAVESLFQVGEIVRKLGPIKHVNAVRLRSIKFNYEPGKYTPAVIDKLAGMNSLVIANPRRLEIETQFLTAGEFRPEHARLVRLLNSRGITVYNNTPLLGGLNDSPGEIHGITYACRNTGIEFHHLYIAGLPVQNAWNTENPVDLYDVIDIATRVRREGSGREIPRYIVRTVLGEADFGLTSSFVGDGGNLAVKLLPYELSDFKSMDPNFEWPENVGTDENGKPIAPISGVRKTADFALC